MSLAQNGPVNLVEIEELAKTQLSQIAFDYYASGANDEITLKENRSAFERIFLRPKMFVDVSERKTSTNVLGTQISMPIGIAPTAFQRLAHTDGEIATARAAGKANTLMILSTLSTTSIEDVMAQAQGPIWFQLYVYKDREITKSLVQRAQAAGCRAIVVTADSPLLGRREKDVRNKFCLPQDMQVANLVSAGLQELPQDVPDSGLAAYISSLYDTSLTWKDFEWLCSLTDLPVLVKGIMRADDAVLAIEHGAAGIIVSNHGGRQLDTVPATITVLPEIAEAVGGEVEVYLDGGVRRGTDVLKALALGARAVFVGRPILWGLALNGEDGVSTVLDLLRQELELSMALAGCASASNVPKDMIYLRSGGGSSGCFLSSFSAPLPAQ